MTNRADIRPAQAVVTLITARIEIVARTPGTRLTNDYGDDKGFSPETSITLLDATMQSEDLALLLQRAHEQLNIVAAKE